MLILQLPLNTHWRERLQSGGEDYSKAGDVINMQPVLLQDVMKTCTIMSREWINMTISSYQRIIKDK